MDFKEYVEFTHTTAKYPNVDTDLVYPTLKLVGECGEAYEAYIKYDEIMSFRNTSFLTKERLDEITNIQANLIKELGDINWYIARFVHVFNIAESQTAYRYTYPGSIREVFINLMTTATKISELVGKSIRDDAGGEIELKKQHLIEKYLHELLFLLGNIYAHFGITCEYVLDLNVAKLTKRVENNTIHGSGDNR